MTERLNQIVNRLAGFLRGWLTEHDGFKRRTFYGETFALLFLQKTGCLTPHLHSELIRVYAAKPKDELEFHWEFNNYALLRYRELTGDTEVSAFLKPLRFKGTLSTNWVLLRLVASWLGGLDRRYIIDEALRTLNDRQKPNGQIWDGKHDRSFQYHTFSTALIGELYQLSGDQRLYDRFTKGLSFIRNFILANGDTLYVGRGQEQCFGYGSLAYALALGTQITQDQTIWGDLERVINYIASYQRNDGGFPLVFNYDEYALDHIPESPAALYGWYPYNNYFDYIPFFGYMLARTSEIIRPMEENANNAPIPKTQPYRDQDYIKIVRPSYEAVLSRPSGFWTNDLAFPYVVYKNESLFPCYGSQEFLQTPKRDQAMPYPYDGTGRRSIRAAVQYSSLSTKRLLLISPLGFMKRLFSFDNNTITIQTVTHSWLPMTNRLVFKRGLRQVDNRELTASLFSIQSDHPLIQSGMAESASGRLLLYQCNSRNTIKIIFK